MGLIAFSSERSRPILVDMAISAPARSIEAHARSTSRLRMTSRIEVSCTSTSYMDSSSESGSIPWLIVRLACGSRSMHSARWPLSTKAAARFSVVVVLATPPFWLVNAMTLAWSVTGASGSAYGGSALPLRSAYSHVRETFLPVRVTCCTVRSVDDGPSGPAAGLRDRQGRCGQDHHHAEPGCRLRGERPPSAVHRPRSAGQPHDEPGDRPRLARAVHVRRAGARHLDPRGHSQARGGPRGSRCRA